MSHFGTDFGVFGDFVATMMVMMKHSTLLDSVECLFVIDKSMTVFATSLHQLLDSIDNM